MFISRILRLSYKVQLNFISGLSCGWRKYILLWLVRHGLYGFDEVALENNVILYHWRDLPDLSGYDTKEKLKNLFVKTFPDDGSRSISMWYGQMWSFIKRIKIGELVILTRERSSRVAVGKVVSEYRYDNKIPNGPWHCRSIEWIHRDVPRSKLPADIRQTLSAQLTVCKIDRNLAEQRLLRALESDVAPRVEESITVDAEFEVRIDPEMGAIDRITQFIGENFRGHGFEEFVAEVLKAKGFAVNVTRPGPDGGIDILAGKGDLGFDSPYLAVQVKSSDYPVGADIITKLNRDLPNFGAEKGLVVAWGGFVDRESIARRKEFFRIRLWNDTDLVRELLANYDSISTEWKNRIPLKRVWALVERNEPLTPSTDS